VSLNDSSRCEQKHRIIENCARMSTADEEVAALQAAIAADASIVHRALPDGEMPLISAVQRKHWGALEVLLRAGAETDEKQVDGFNAGFTAAHLCAAGGHADALRLLHKHAADPMLMVNAGRSSDHWRPLHCCAAAPGTSDALRFLVAHGAAVNAKAKDGNTPLVSLAGLGRYKDVAYLLAHGAAPAFADADGNTLMHVALEHGVFAAMAGDRDLDAVCLDVAVVLAIHGVSASTPNKAGDAPTQYAAKALPRLPATLALLAAHSKPLMASPREWDYAALVNLGVEDFIACGVPFDAAFDLFEHFDHLEVERCEYAREAEARGAGGCPFRPAKKAAAAALGAAEQQKVLDAIAGTVHADAAAAAAAPDAELQRMVMETLTSNAAAVSPHAAIPDGAERQRVIDAIALSVDGDAAAAALAKPTTAQASAFDEQHHMVVDALRRDALARDAAPAAGFPDSAAHHPFLDSLESNGGVGGAAAAVDQAKKKQQVEHQKIIDTLVTSGGISGAAEAVDRANTQQLDDKPRTEASGEPAQPLKPATPAPIAAPAPAVYPAEPATTAAPLVTKPLTLTIPTTVGFAQLRTALLVAIVSVFAADLLFGTQWVLA
jgi:hypothetical protein